MLNKLVLASLVVLSVVLSVVLGCAATHTPVYELPIIVEPVIPATVVSTPGGMTLEPTFNMVRGSSTKMWVLKWRATVTNDSEKVATTVLVQALADGGDVRAADEEKCEVGPGHTANLEGAMDIPETEVFKIKIIRVSLRNGG